MPSRPDIIAASPFEFGARLRSERLRRDLSQRDLAHQLEISPTALRRIESGVAGGPRYDTLTRIANVLDVSLDDMVLGGARVEELADDGVPADRFEVAGAVDPSGAPLSTTADAFQRMETVVRGVSDEVLSRIADAPHLLREMHWRDFEELIAELFARDGFDVTLTPGSGDRGVDLYAVRHTGLGSLLYVVQAKQWAENRPVGPDVVLQLRGVIERERASAGVIATTSSFTPGARREQEDLRWRISLREYDDLRRWLRRGRILDLPPG